MTARKMSRVDRPAPAERERQQIAVAAEGAQVLHRGFEAMRLINDRAVQGAILRFTDAAEKCKAPREPLELLAIPGELLRLQMEGTAAYLQELSGAALEMQAELLGCSTHLVDTDAVMQTASVFGHLPAFPFFPTWGGHQR